MILLPIHSATLCGTPGPSAWRLSLYPVFCDSFQSWPTCIEAKGRGAVEQDPLLPLPPYLPPPRGAPFYLFIAGFLYEILFGGAPGA